MKTVFWIPWALFIGTGIATQPLPVQVDLVSDGNRLDAKFYPAESEGLSATVILLHGFPGNDNNPLGLAERLQQKELNVLVFNYQGTFKSEGLFNFDHCQDDIQAALEFVKQRDHIRQYGIDSSRIVFCGYSLGGSFALTAAIRNPEIKNIISITGGNDQAIYLHSMAADSAYRTAFEKGISTAFSPAGPVKGDPVNLHAYFDKIIPEVNNYDLVYQADKLKNRKILFCVGSQDHTIPPQEYIIPVFNRLLELGAEEVRLNTFNTDHSFGNVRDELTRSIAEWLKH